jgi:mercuric ion transport protein
MAFIKLNKNASIGAAVFSAVSLKLCCWGPLLLTSIAGVSGSSVYFSWLIILKPYLLTVAFLSLGFAFYQVYKPKKAESCCSGNCKAEKKSFFKSKLYVWLVAVLVVTMTLISYFPQFFYRTVEKEIIIIDDSTIELVKLNIEGMTCSGCEENINHTVNQLDGILEIKTSYKAGASEIKFDNKKTTQLKIENKIESLGYVIEKD